MEQHALPTGTVTFLFTDVEASTLLLEKLGEKRYSEALQEHRRVIREACSAGDGVEVDTQGDALFMAFPTAPAALAAAAEIAGGLEEGPIRVRIGVHTGTPLLTEEGYVGVDVHRAARIAAAAHGGQVVVSASTAALVRVELRDLGAHRFKDLSAAERVYQLGDADFPPLRSLYRTNLPVPATPFLGRQRELVGVVDLLTRGDVRLLSLTGPGGSGKTRLAIQAAAEASDVFPDGLFWVPVAALRDSGLVLSAVADSFDVKEERGRPVLDTLAERLAGRHVLLVVDNVEHLLPSIALELARLVDACPSAVVLVTSRESLRLSAEREYIVGPFAAPDAVSFLQQRAAAHGVELDLSSAVVDLCRRLDDLPLALELAASRLKLFTPEQLHDRLAERLDLLRGERDTDPRQQTLRATIAWSYDLLAEEERRLFRRLGVFSAGCSFELAESVSGADAEGLQSLLDKSLLRRRDAVPGPRYWMLATIRQFAVESLDGSKEGDEIRERHALAYLALAEESRRKLRGPEQVEWLRRLIAEQDDLRAALDWSISTYRVALALRLACGLEVFWIRAERASEATRWLDRVLELDAAGHADLRARALATGSIFAPTAEVAWRRISESVAVLRQLEDEEGLAFALRGLAWLHRDRGELAEARMALEEALDLFRRLGHTVTTRLFDLGAIARDEGDLPAAGAWFERSLAAADEEGDLIGAVAAHEALGSLAVEGGELREAHERFREAIRLSQSLHLGMADAATLESIQGLAAVALRRGDAELAGRLWETATRLGQAADSAIWPRVSEYQHLATDALTPADRLSFERGREQATALELDGALAWILEDLARSADTNAS